MLPGSAPQDTSTNAGRGYGRSVLLGATFSIAWSPCIGPILAIVLTLAAASGTVLQGMVLLVAYALGLGMWFLAVGAFFGWLAPRLRRVQRYTPALLGGSGVVFIGIGTLMVIGEFGRLNAYVQSFGFLFGSATEAEAGLSQGVQGAAGPAIAFLGGILSFLSPCVLPLVPVYMANLTGEAVTAASRGARGARRRVLLHSVAFVAGFTLVFALLGASVGLVGSLAVQHLDTMTRIGGGVLIVLGLQLTGLIRIPYLDRTYQVPSV
ncbi:MAG: cytochrome c biogenesis CcdA family protein [Dehalococcoidia bacterium]